MDDRSVERSENGKIVKADLSSEEARRMAELRWSKARDYSEDLTALLAEAGFPDPAEAPVHLRLLAEQAAAGGARSVQAVVQFIRATREGTRLDGGTWDFSRGSCPTCGRSGSVIPPTIMKQLLEVMQNRKPHIESE